MKRKLALFLAFVMVFASVPQLVFAYETEPGYVSETPETTTGPALELESVTPTAIDFMPLSGPGVYYAGRNLTRIPIGRYADGITEGQTLSGGHSVVVEYDLVMNILNHQAAINIQPSGASADNHWGNGSHINLRLGLGDPDWNNGDWAVNPGNPSGRPFSGWPGWDNTFATHNGAGVRAMGEDTLFDNIRHAERYMFAVGEVYRVRHEIYTGANNARHDITITNEANTIVIDITDIAPASVDAAMPNVAYIDIFANSPGGELDDSFSISNINAYVDANVRVRPFSATPNFPANFYAFDTPQTGIFDVTFDVRYHSPAVGHNIRWGIVDSSYSGQDVWGARGMVVTINDAMMRTRVTPGTGESGGQQTQHNIGRNPITGTHQSIRISVNLNDNTYSMWLWDSVLHNAPVQVGAGREVPWNNLTPANPIIGAAIGMAFQADNRGDFTIYNLQVGTNLPHRAPGEGYVIVIEDVDKTELEALVTIAEAREETDYYTNTWTPFASALSNAKAVLDNEVATQVAVDAAWLALSQAINGLVRLGESVTRPNDANDGFALRTRAGYNRSINVPFEMDSVIYGGRRAARNTTGNTLWFDVIPSANNATGHIGFSPLDRRIDTGNAPAPTNYTTSVQFVGGFIHLRNGDTMINTGVPVNGWHDYRFMVTFNFDDYTYWVRITHEYWGGYVGTYTSPTLSFNTTREDATNTSSHTSNSFQYIGTPSEGITNIGQINLQSGTGYLFFHGFSAGLRGLTDNWTNFDMHYNNRVPMPTPDSNGITTWYVGPSSRFASLHDVVNRYNEGDIIVLEAGTVFSGPFIPTRGGFTLRGADPENRSGIIVGAQTNVVMLSMLGGNGTTPVVLENFTVHGNMDDILEIASCDHQDIRRGMRFVGGTESHNMFHWMGHNNVEPLNFRGIFMPVDNMANEVTMNNVEIYGNYHGMQGGARGNVTLNNSHFHNNSTDGFGHNVYLMSVTNNEVLTITNSEISHIRSTSGNGIKSIFGRNNIYNNLFHNNAQAFELIYRPGSPFVGRERHGDIVNNIFIVSDWSFHGIRLGSESLGTGSSGIYRVMNNTFIAEGSSLTDQVNFIRLFGMVGAVELYNNVFYNPRNAENVFLTTPGYLQWPASGRQLYGRNNWIGDNVISSSPAHGDIGINIATEMFDTIRGYNPMLGADLRPLANSPLVTNPGVPVDTVRTWQTPVSGVPTLPNPLTSLAGFGRTDDAAPVLGALQTGFDLPAVDVTPIPPPPPQLPPQPPQYPGGGLPGGSSPITQPPREEAPGGNGGNETPWVNPFTDVSSSDWFYEAVRTVNIESLFVGTSATTFSPNATMTRGMIITALHRLAGVPVTGSASSVFADVASGTWYTDAVIWAASVGIISGFGDGTFRPYEDITREQMALLFFNYANYAGIQLPSNGVDSFADQAQISNWAAKAVMIMLEAGVVRGRPNGDFDPQSNATRAEVAMLFHNFILKVLPQE